MNKLLALLLLTFSGVLHSHNLTIEECLEGSEFIRNAALLRDSGRPEGTKQEFIGRMEQDIEKIQAYPPELRWFVQDEEDKEFLLSQAKLVWDNPQPPQNHEQEFLNTCTNR